MKLDKIRENFSGYFKKMNPESNGNFSILLNHDNEEWFSCSCGYCVPMKKFKKDKELKKLIKDDCWGFNKIKCPSCGESVYYDFYVDPTSDEVGLYYTFETKEEGDCDIIEVTAHGIKFDNFDVEEIDTTSSTVIAYDRKNKRIFTIYDGYRFSYSGLTYSEKGVEDADGEFQEYDSFDLYNSIDYDSGHDTFVVSGLLDLARELIRITGVPDFTVRDCRSDDIHSFVCSFNSLMSTFIDVVNVGFLTIDEFGEQVVSRFGTRRIDSSIRLDSLYYHNPLVKHCHDIVRAQRNNAAMRDKYNLNAETLEECLGLNTECIEDTAKMIGMADNSESNLERVHRLWTGGFFEEMLDIAYKFKPDEVASLLYDIDSFIKDMDDENIGMKKVLWCMGFYDDGMTSRDIHNNLWTARTILKDAGKIIDINKKISEQNLFPKYRVLKFSALSSKQYDELYNKPTLDTLAKLLSGSEE